MFSTSELSQLIETRIGQLSFNRPPAALYNPIVYSLGNGGKRIRPLLTLMACNMFSEKIDEAISPALGLEVFHNFTLLHDDIMDNAAVRRNKPTVHLKWNANTAILSGDAMMIEASKLVSQCPDAKFRSVLELFNQTALEVCEGQMFDMEFETRKWVTEAEYLEMIRLKTAVLIGASLKTGAIIGGATLEQSDLLYQFGINLGLSFQLLDDWLDTFGDESVFGKKIGGDISANKKTFLLIKAFETASAKQKEDLEDGLRMENKDDKIKHIVKIYNELDISKITLNKAEGYSKAALSCIQNLKLGETKVAPLLDLSNQLLKRNK